MRVEDRTWRTICTKAGIVMIVMMMFLGVWGAQPSYAEETVQYQQVKTLRWKAKLRKQIKVNLNGEKIILKKGQTVIVTNRQFSGKRKPSTVLIGDKEIKVSNSKLVFIKDLCSVNTEGDYDVPSKEHFVANMDNEKNILVWISLDKQRVNVFERSSKADPWHLIQCFKCSTGKAETPTTPHMYASVSFKRAKYKYFKTGGTLKYFTEVSGSGMHKWVGGQRKRLGNATASNGCIRLSEKDAKWIYDNVPVKARVVVW